MSVSLPSMGRHLWHTLLLVGSSTLPLTAVANAPLDLTARSRPAGALVFDALVSRNETHVSQQQYLGSYFTPRAAWWVADGIFIGASADVPIDGARFSLSPRGEFGVNKPVDVGTWIADIQLDGYDFGDGLTLSPQVCGLFEFSKSWIRPLLGVRFDLEVMPSDSGLRLSASAAVVGVNLDIESIEVHAQVQLSQVHAVANQSAFFSPIGWVDARWQPASTPGLGGRIGMLRSYGRQVSGRAVSSRGLWLSAYTRMIF